jgi:hypothetical protein
VGCKKVTHLPTYSSAVFQPPWRYDKDGASPQSAAIFVIPLCQSFDLLLPVGHACQPRQYLHYSARDASLTAASAPSTTALTSLEKDNGIMRIIFRALRHSTFGRRRSAKSFVRDGPARQ